MLLKMSHYSSNNEAISLKGKVFPNQFEFIPVTQSLTQYNIPTILCYVVATFAQNVKNMLDCMGGGTKSQPRLDYVKVLRIESLVHVLDNHMDE
jgi:hypothetical protein